MIGPSFALSVGKPSPANTIENDTKVYIVVKRSLCAAENSSLAGNGVVAVNSRAPMLWGGTFDPRLVAFASSPFWTKKQPKEPETG